MMIPFTDRKGYAAALAKGLRKLGPKFTAELCYWCNGQGIRNYEPCDVCGRHSGYGLNNGLLWDAGFPAPDSVAHQVLNAAGYKWPE